MARRKSLPVTVTLGEAHWKAILEILAWTCNAEGGEWSIWQCGVSRVINKAIAKSKAAQQGPKSWDDEWLEFMNPLDNEPLDFDGQGNPYGHPSYGID